MEAVREQIALDRGPVGTEAADGCTLYAALAGRLGRPLPRPEGREAAYHLHRQSDSDTTIYFLPSSVASLPARLPRSAAAIRNARQWQEPRLPRSAPEGRAAHLVYMTESPGATSGGSSSPLAA